MMFIAHDNRQKELFSTFIDHLFTVYTTEVVNNPVLFQIWLECAPRPSVLAALPNLSDELKTQAMTVGMEVCRTEYEPPDIAPTWLDEQELMATFIQLFPADG